MFLKQPPIQKLFGKLGRITEFRSYQLQITELEQVKNNLKHYMMTKK